jgi:hypothetical protein
MKILFLLFMAFLVGNWITWNPPTFTQGLFTGLGILFLLQLTVIVLYLP